MTDGWEGHQFPPEAKSCEHCGQPMPRTRKRGKAFGGRGRERRFCGDACRKASSRERAAAATSRRARR